MHLTPVTAVVSCHSGQMPKVSLSTQQQRYTRRGGERVDRRKGGASRSQSALHMHVLVCICSNVRQFHKIIGMTQMCYHTIVCT